MVEVVLESECMEGLGPVIRQHRNGNGVIMGRCERVVDYYDKTGQKSLFDSAGKKNIPPHCNPSCIYITGYYNIKPKEMKTRILNPGNI